MYCKNPTLSIILPTYNERENILSIVDELALLLERTIEYEVIIVDDNSPDGTGKVADKLSRSNDTVRLICRPSKMGLSSAVMDGLRVANGDFIVVMDADLQHPPKLLHALLDGIANGVDLVIASRYVNNAGINEWHVWRKIVSRGATLFARVSLPRIKSVKDPLSGYFVFRRSLLEGMRLSGIGCKLLLEIVASGKCKRIVEVPYIFESRRNGMSKLKLKDYVDFVKLLFFLKRIRNDGKFSRSYIRNPE